MSQFSRFHVYPDPCILIMNADLCKLTSPRLPFHSGKNLFLNVSRRYCCVVGVKKNKKNNLQSRCEEVAPLDLYELSFISPCLRWYGFLKPAKRKYSSMIGHADSGSPNLTLLSWPSHIRKETPLPLPCFTQGLVRKVGAFHLTYEHTYSHNLKPADPRNYSSSSHPASPAGR